MKRVSLVRFLAMPVALFMAGLATSSVTSACSIAFSPISVGPSFKVEVSGYDGPVKGLLLNLTGPKDRTHSALTDDDGIASFHYLPSGTHYLKADHDNGYGKQLDVKPNGPASIIVPMRWPAIEPIHVRSLSGTMRAPDAVPSRLEQRILSLDLLEGISGEILSSALTTSRGAFDFGKLSPGLYFIHLKRYSAVFGPVEGLIGIAVDQAAPARADKLDLNLTWTSCGLQYIDLFQCTQLDLHVTMLEGHATGSVGRPPHQVEILLLDAAQNLVAHVSTDSKGNFSFPGSLAGTFELRIEGGGITPVHALLDINPSAANSSLEIEAGYGRCTSVRAK